MSKKKPLQVYVAEPIDKLLNDRRSDDSGPSMIMNAVAERYIAIVHHSMPSFRSNEWFCILDAMNGTWMIDGAAWSAQMNVLANTQDHIKLNGADRTWSIEDPEEFLGRLASLSFCEYIAIMDACERFWDDDTSSANNGSIAKFVGKDHILEG